MSFGQWGSASGWIEGAPPLVGLRGLRPRPSASPGIFRARRNSGCFWPVRDVTSMQGKKRQAAHENEAERPDDIEVEPALGQKGEAEPVIDAKRQRAAGHRHRQRMQ